MQCRCCCVGAAAAAFEGRPARRGLHGETLLSGIDKGLLVLSSPLLSSPSTSQVSAQLPYREGNWEIHMNFYFSRWILFCCSLKLYLNYFKEYVLPPLVGCDRFPKAFSHPVSVRVFVARIDDDGRGISSSHGCLWPWLFRFSGGEDRRACSVKFSCSTHSRGIVPVVTV